MLSRLVESTGQYEHAIIALMGFFRVVLSYSAVDYLASTVGLEFGQYAFSRLEAKNAHL